MHKIESFSILEKILNLDSRPGSAENQEPANISLFLITGIGMLACGFSYQLMHKALSEGLLSGFLRKLGLEC
jgi:hypothetical protein